MDHHIPCKDTMQTHYLGQNYVEIDNLGNENSNIGKSFEENHMML